MISLFRVRYAPWRSKPAGRGGGRGEEERELQDEEP